MCRSSSALTRSSSQVNVLEVLHPLEVAAPSRRRRWRGCRAPRATPRCSKISSASGVRGRVGALETMRARTSLALSSVITPPSAAGTSTSQSSASSSSLVHRLAAAEALHGAAWRARARAAAATSRPVGVRARRRARRRRRRPCRPPRAGSRDDVACRRCRSPAPRTRARPSPACPTSRRISSATHTTPRPGRLLAAAASRRARPACRSRPPASGRGYCEYWSMIQAITCGVGVHVGRGDVACRGR